MPDLNFFNFISQDFFNKFAETFISCFLFFSFLFLLFGFIKIKSFFGTVLKFKTFEIFKLLNNILINGVNHVDDFNVFFLESFNEGWCSSSSSWLSSDDIDVFLIFFLSSNVFFERDHLFSWFWSMISKELS